MLEIPEKIEPLVSDYRMNLVQVRSSGKLCFSDPDVNMVFDMSRLIYARDYEEIKEVFDEMMEECADGEYCLFPNERDYDSEDEDGL